MNSSDGCILSIGHRNSVWDSLSKINQSGTFLWTKLYGTSGKDYMNKLTYAPDGGIIVVGFEYQTSDYQKALILKYK